MLNVVLLSVPFFVALSAIMLSVVMLSIVVPLKGAPLGTSTFVKNSSKVESPSITLKYQTTLIFF